MQNMITLGIDFDNTIIEYDEAFYNLALQKKIVDGECGRSKDEVKKYLIERDKEHEFTKLQAKIYGEEIQKVKPKIGMVRALMNVDKKKARILIISHKTKYPYTGERINLHRAARSWLKRNGFFDRELIGLKNENVYFEETIDQKIKRIEATNCDYFIDDLSNIINMIKSQGKATPIHFTQDSYNDDRIVMNDWSELSSICKEIF